MAVCTSQNSLIQISTLPNLRVFDSACNIRSRARLYTTIIEKSEALNTLVAVIHHAIKARGSYLLMDDRLKHICGDNYAEDTSSNRDLIAAFAEKHQLSWHMNEGLLMFTPGSVK
jgi:hypothetical protein